MENLVFLFWIAPGAAYRILSRAFGIPMSSVHRMVHRIAEEVVAVRGSFIKLQSNYEEVKAMGEGYPAFAKAAGARGVSRFLKHPGLSPRGNRTVRVRQILLYTLLRMHFFS